jgi:hypothetical protein
MRAMMACRPTASVQPPRARYIRRFQKTNDLAREAVGWNTMLDGNRIARYARRWF